MRPRKRSAAVAAAATAVLGVLGATIAAAAPPAGRAATVDRIVIYKGDDVTPAVGPAGPLSTTKWTTDTVPAKISTNDGTLVEDTALTAPGVTKGGTWWYKAGPAAVILHAFHWEKKDGATVEATNLSSMASDNNAWFDLGNGTYSPRCLSFLPPATTQPIFIQLTKEGGDWKTTTEPCTTAP
jgi:hypothetical protein